MMLSPQEKKFEKLAKEYDVVPVYMTVPADLETPVSVYLKIASSRPYSFLLESGDLGEKARYSFIGCEPFLTIEAERGGTVVIEEGGRDWRSEKDSLQVLRELKDSLKVYEPHDLDTFWGGAVGYLSYDMVKQWEKIPSSPGEEVYPHCEFFFPRKVLIYDHRRHLLTLVYIVYTKNDHKDTINYTSVYEDARLKLQLMLHNLRSNDAYNRSSSHHEIKFSSAKDSLNKNEFQKGEFISAVDKAKEYISAGDIFQVVLSRHKSRELKVHPFTVYRAMRSLNPSPYQFYLSLSDFQLVGASPEMLVSLNDGKATTRPIAGTRPRGRDQESDKSLAGDLKKDEKERAEHMMLVDLGRNDLGRVCEYGSVEVGKLLEIEYYSHVIHLVSEVTGKLQKDCDFVDLIRASFPAGTVSGAPKVRAMEIISEFEPVSRGPYAGAVGYIGFNGDMDTCITIRTIITRGNKAYIQAGAGIVADSVPEREFEETGHKMAGAEKALEMAEELEINDPYHR